MGKKLKTFALFCVIALSCIVLFNLVSSPPEKQFDPKVHASFLKPINFSKKKFPDYSQDSDDLAIKYARLWKLPEAYDDVSESCLEIFADQHPNNLVQKQQLTSLYGIEIGTSYWYELTGAFEKYASESCYAFSGNEIEIIYADKLKEKLTEEEIIGLLKFFNTELGNKYVDVSENISAEIRQIVTEKQREASIKVADDYNRSIEELQAKVQ